MVPVRSSSAPWHPVRSTSPSAAYTYGQRLPYGSPNELPEHPLAITTLVLGIVGIAAMFVAFPFLSPVAWFLGAKARRDARRAGTVPPRARRPPVTRSAWWAP